MQLIRVIPVTMMLFAALVLKPAIAAEVAHAGARSRLMAHYTHQRWSQESDAPRPVYALAQDRSGYVWIAAAGGLFRFDGVRFEPVSAGIDLLSEGAPSAILVRRNGEVWTNFMRSGRFAAYREGRLRFLDAPRSTDRVMAMHETSDGTIWMLTEGLGVPLLRFRGGRWTRFGSEAGAPVDNPLSMVVTPDGAVWISFSSQVARLAPGATRFEAVRKDSRALGRLSLDPADRVWITDIHGSYPLTGPGGQGKPPPLRHAYATDTSEIRGLPRFDREGNLWIATYYRGMQRIARPDPRGAATATEARAQVEQFTARDGLSSNATIQIFQDAEGNVWAGTENGLDRFWPATLRFEPQLTHPAAFGDLLLRGSDGSVYIGQARAVYRVPPGGRPEIILRIPDNEPRTLCEAPDGAIWISLSKGYLRGSRPAKPIVIWDKGKVRNAPPAPLDYVVYDCAFDGSGDFWLTAWLGGMARLHHGRWQKIGDASDRGFAPRSMLADRQGRIVVHWSDRILSRLDGDQRRSFQIPFGDYRPDDTSLHVDAPGRLFIAGEFGLARLRNERFETISARQVPLLSGVNGMVRSASGDTWLASADGIIKLRSEDLDRAFSRRGWSPPMEVFNSEDGLLSRPHTHSRNAIVEGGDGRLWIATQTGTLSLDPSEVARSDTPPRVAVSAVIADKVYRDPSDVELPAGRSNVQIDFAVLSFSNPRATRVRYRIEGQDADWVEAGTRRQAFYTNLMPGTYRFRLIAANENGRWNAEGATVTFTIPPTFFQSRWFLALCVAIAASLLWLVYRLRMAQVAGQIRARLEERHGERERIARELHDTLLQSVQGLVLRFQSVANKMPAGGTARGQLESALTRADEIIAEGRGRVQNLRSAGDKSDLPGLFRERAEVAGLDSSVTVRLVVEGRQRSVDPLVAVELARVVDEALFNIRRHAHASAVEILIRFGTGELGVEVRDDGIGFPAEVLAEGHRPGHFGLIGMRERAVRIGCSFSIDSRPGMGSAVTMTLPSRLAFASPSPGRNWRWLVGFFGERKQKNAA